MLQEDDRRIIPQTQDKKLHLATGECPCKSCEIFLSAVKCRANYRGSTKSADPIRCRKQYHMEVLWKVSIAGEDRLRRVKRHRQVVDRPVTVITAAYHRWWESMSSCSASNFAGVFRVRPPPPGQHSGQFPGPWPSVAEKCCRNSKLTILCCCGCHGNQ